MALFDTIRAGASGAADYEIERSLRSESLIVPTKPIKEKMLMKNEIKMKKMMRRPKKVRNQMQMCTPPT